jgi:putative heme-binding domain-containing protein
MQSHHGWRSLIVGIPLAVCGYGGLPGAEAGAEAHRGLAPPAALAALRVADGLVVEQIASEPDIAKPVFLNFDERGRMWVVQYRQYPDPAGLTRLSHDQYWRSAYDRVSPPPPHQFPGQDRITVLSSSAGDGVFDQRREFLTGLNITTAVERGRGGVWVLNPPYLLFYPGADADDVPPGDPVVHLSGFNFEDTHSVANSLRWGPDGWLYGAVGSTVTTDIVRPGLDHEPLCHIVGQGIWRYHPATRRFELFAEGGGNTFGVEFDDQGRIFSGHNGGDTRGFYYQQGAYELKGFEKHGPLSNPYAFGFFPPMPSANPIARFSHNFVVYGGGALPASFTGKLIAIDPLHGELIESALIHQRSAFTTADERKLVTSADAWFRPVDIKTGPDGALYLCDWYDQQINHYRNHEGHLDHSLGRIYRIRAAGAVQPARFDLGALPSSGLVAQLRNGNRWFRQTALRLLGDRRDPGVIPELRRMLVEENGQTAREALWALNLSGGLDDDATLAALAHRDPFVRLWAARLRCDDRQVPPAIAARLAAMAATEPDIEVRAQLACSAKRLPAEAGIPIVRALLTHDQDADDPRQPLLLWWAIEAKAESDRELVLALVADPLVATRPLVRDHVLTRLMRRYVAAGTRKDLLACARLLDQAPDAAAAASLLRGLDEAGKGRSLAGFPDELVAALARRGGGSLAMQVRAGDAAARDQALHVIADGTAELSARLACIEALGDVAVPGAVPVLLALLASPEPRVVQAALAALQRYDDGAIPEAVLSRYARLQPAQREAAQALLASRIPWARRLVAAVKDGTVPLTGVAMTEVRKLRLSGDPDLDRLVDAVWGKIGAPSNADMERQIARLEQVVRQPGGDPRAGHALFQTACAGCHALFGQGGHIGPDLTSAKRDDLDGLLLSIVNPSAEIREGFATCLVATSDGRSLVGFVADQDERVVVLRGLDGQLATIDRTLITSMRSSGASLMPEGLLAGYDDRQVRDLFAYLRSTQPVAGK